jgi:hypothetical protein
MRESQSNESREYRELLDTLRGRGRGFKEPGELYQSLMAKERRVLDTIDRVVNDSVRSDREERSLLQLPLHELGVRAIAAARGLFHDVVEARRPRDVLNAVTKDDRMVYLGVFLILLALCVAFVDLTG